MKIKYVLYSGLITTFLFPLSFIIPLVGSSTSFMYTAPLGLIGGILGSSQQFVINTMFIIFPNSVGWLIVLPFWFLFGGIIGYILFTYRDKYYSQLGKGVPTLGFLGIVMVLCLQVLMHFFLAYLTTPFVQKEQAQAKADQQNYYDEKCLTVYTKEHNYKVLKCPDTIVGDLAGTTEYFSEQKK